MPDWKPEIRTRLAGLNLEATRELEIVEEISQHLDDRFAELRAGEASEEEARRLALEELSAGGLERELRRVERPARQEPMVLGQAKGNMLENVYRDLCYCLRTLRRNPGFAATVILTLTLGIGATTAIFSVVDVLMLKPLPFPSADRLVRMRSVIAATGQGGIASYPDFLDWRARNHVFDGMGVFEPHDFTLIGPLEPLHLHGAVVSAQLFSLLAVAPALGRGFLPEEDNPAATSGADPVILSYGLWQRCFGSEASVLGRTIQFGDQPFTVIGVMPKGFQFPLQAESIELWTTIAIDARVGASAVTSNRGAHYLDVIALLKRGITREKAEAEMGTITAALNKEHPENKPRSARIVPEIQALIGPLRTPLLVLQGVVGCVLLIVCANVANLLLARATARHKEMAMRAALGASRQRAICQLLTESVTLGLMGGGLGLALGLASVSRLARLLPLEVPRLNSLGLDARLLGFAFLISLLAGILFGLAPALRVAKIDLTESLKNGRGSGSGGREHSRLRDALVVSEIALALVLLPVTGLLIQSFLHLTRVDPGFDPHQVLTFQLDSPSGKQDAQVLEFFREVVRRMSDLPGASLASAVASLPLTGDNIRSSIEIEGQPTQAGSRPSVDFNVAQPGYFHTMGMTLVAGRDFTAYDDSKSTPVVVINRTLARRFFPNQNPIGKHIRPGIGTGYGPGDPPMREIVGIIGDVKQGDLGAETTPEVYAPLAQSPFRSMFLVIRTGNDPQSMAQAAHRQVASLDRSTPIFHVRTLDEYFAQSLAGPRFITLLLSGFAALAVVLACLGVYGVMSYRVAQRTHEIGVRMALGAEAGKILRWVLTRGCLLGSLGVMIGLPVSFGLAHLLASLLYGVGATDPATFAIASLVLLGVATLASYIPARRAASVDPTVALRYE